MTTGYPVGTECVVTWTHSLCVTVRIGLIVTVTSPAYVWRAGQTNAFGRVMRRFKGTIPDGELVHQTDLIGPNSGLPIAIPVAWLRPLRDPDAELEPVESVEETA